MLQISPRQHVALAYAGLGRLPLRDQPLCCARLALALLLYRRSLDLLVDADPDAAVEAVPVLAEGLCAVQRVLVEQECLESERAAALDCVEALRERLTEMSPLSL